MIKKIITNSFLFLIQFYQIALAPLLGGKHCRFHPSCSAYAEEALRKYSLGKALIKSIGRLLRCHPFSKGGYDPV